MDSLQDVNNRKKQYIKDTLKDESLSLETRIKITMLWIDFIEANAKDIGKRQQEEKDNE